MTTRLPFPQEVLVAESFPSLTALLERCQRAVAQSLFPGTAMLVGEPWAGREALAVELAAALICPQGRFGCQCSQCRRVRQGIHPDLHVIGVEAGHQEIRMEDVEPLLASFRQVPFEGKKRVYLLTNAHTPPLNVYAASALLKTLEEPVAHAHWLLLAANPLKVLPTIVSRSVLLRLPPPPPEWLAQILGPEAQQLSQQVPASLGALQSQGPKAEAFVSAVRPLLRQLLQGDLLSLLRINALAREDPSLPTLAASLALAEVSHEAGEDAERLLEVAEGYLRAQQLHQQLHVPLETVAFAAVAPTVLKA